MRATCGVLCLCLSMAAFAVDTGPRAVEGVVVRALLGGAVSGASITVRVDAGVIIDATTGDAEGRFRCTGLPPGKNCQLLVEAPGCAAAVVAIPPDVKAPLRVALHREAVLIGGVVEAASRAPVAAAMVQVRREPFSFILTRTDAMGRFRVGGLGNQRVTIHAWGPRLFPSEPEPLSLTPVAGQTVECPPLVLAAARRVEVRAYDSRSRRPIPALRLICNDTTPGLPEYLDVTPVSPQLWLPARAVSLIVAATDYLDGSVKLAPAGGGQPTTAEVALRPMIRVAVSVADSAERPIAGASVRYGRRQRNRFTGRTEHTMVASATGYAQFATDHAGWVAPWVEKEGYAPGTQRIETSAGDAQARITLYRPGTLHGRVLLPDGSPVASATVTLLPKAEGYELDAVRVGAADGHWRREGLWPGNFTYDINADAPGMYSDPLKDAHVEEGRESAVADIALRPLFSFSGRVKEEQTGRPIAGVRIALSHAGGKPDYQAESGVDGGFRIAGVRPGKYQCRSQYASDELAEHYPEIRYLPGVEFLDRDIDNYVVMIPRGILLSGRVIDAATGGPLPGARVYVSPIQQRKPPDSVSWETTTTTDEDGRLRSVIRSSVQT